jgi:hypothetical protein
MTVTPVACTAKAATSRSSLVHPPTSIQMGYMPWMQWLAFDVNGSWLIGYG